MPLVRNKGGGTGSIGAGGHSRPTAFTPGPQHPQTRRFPREWKKTHEKAPHLRGFLVSAEVTNYSSGTISNATMLMILINGLIAGPAVSL